MEIAHFLDDDSFSINNNLVIEQIFCRRSIKEVHLRLFYDIRQVYKEQEVPVSLLIKIEHKPGHNQCLSATGRHMEQDLRRILAQIPFKIGNEILEGFFLIRAKLKVWIDVLLYV